MREELQRRRRVLTVLAGVGLVGVLTALVLASPLGLRSVDEAPAAAPSVPVTEAPAPSPAPSSAPSEAAPSADEADVQLPTAPLPAPAPAGEPGILSLDAQPSAGCAAPTARADLAISWEAQEGNTVDVYYALTVAPDLATDGFVPIGTGLPSTGTLSVPRSCPEGSEPLPFITLKIVANGAVASVSAHYWGL